MAPREGRGQVSEMILPLWPLCLVVGMGVPWWGRAMGLASPQAGWVSCLHPAPWKLSVLDRCKESALSPVHSASKGLPRGQPTHHKLHETCFNAKGTRCSLQLLGVAHMFYRLCWEHEKGSGHHQLQSVLLLVFPPRCSFAFSPHSLPLPRQLRQSAENILCFTRFSCANLKALTQKEANGVCVCVSPPWLNGKNTDLGVTLVWLPIPTLPLTRCNFGQIVQPSKAPHPCVQNGGPPHQDLFKG